jgi:hypothetical protein
MTEACPPNPDLINVVSWNVLLDKKRTAKGLISAQSERLPSQVDTLKRLDINNIDVALIQESHGSKELHCGEEMARQLGYQAGFWFEHNTSRRRGDYIGVFGARVESAEPIELPHDKLAILTKLGETAFVAIHLRRERVGPMRAEQAEVLVERLDGLEHVVIGGDPNALFFQKARRILRAAGFGSAFHLTGQRNPKTHPTPEYRKVFYAPVHRPILPRGTASDIIYTRGMNVHTAARFHGDSDHYGLYGTVSPDG